jgi:hypothetical protein
MQFDIVYVLIYFSDAFIEFMHRIKRQTVSNRGTESRESKR